MIMAVIAFVSMLVIGAALEALLIISAVVILGIVFATQAIRMFVGERVRRWRFPRARVRRRGVDFPCEACQRNAGSYLEDGWFRCNHCRYPGK